MYDTLHLIYKEYLMSKAVKHALCNFWEEYFNHTGMIFKKN